MSESNLNEPHFQDAEKAREYLERVRWSNGINCPHCGAVGDHYKLQGKSTRPGVYKCADCREQFSVTVGTVFERSKIALNIWLQAVYLLCSSKKGISTHQLHRTLGVTYKTAWFMTHRIREAMRSGDLSPFGSGGGTVEVDETFIGTDKAIKPKGQKKGRGYAHKNKILSLVDRNSGQARSMVVDNLQAKTLVPILKANIDREASDLHRNIVTIYFTPAASTLAEAFGATPCERPARGNQDNRDRLGFLVGDQSCWALLDAE